MKIISTLFLMLLVVKCGTITIEKALEKKENWKMCYSGKCTNGTGMYIYSSTRYYSGGWKNGKYHGNGRYVDKTGFTVIDYNGEWKDGQKHGQGVLTLKYIKPNESSHYSGNFKYDQYDGKGDLTITNDKTKQTIQYSGEFKYGHYHGKGKLIGTKRKTDEPFDYSGDFKNGLIAGKGELYLNAFKSNEEVRYSGEFKSGDHDPTFYGTGELAIINTITKKTTKYSGSFRNNKMHGKGILVKSDGTRLQGVFENDRFSMDNYTSAWVSNKDGLRMRGKPSTDGEIITVIPSKDEVKILEEVGETLMISGASGKWTKIIHDGKEGWVFGGFLSREYLFRTIHEIPVISEISGKWVLLQEGEWGGRAILDYYGRHMHINIGGSNKQYLPLLTIAFIQDTVVYVIENCKKSGSNVTCSTIYYNVSHEKPDSNRAGENFYLQFIDGNREAKISYTAHGQQKEGFFVREEYSSKYRKLNMGK